MLCVKLWDVETVAPRLAPLLAGGGVAIPVPERRRGARFSCARSLPQRVLGGIAYIAATIREPGVDRAYRDDGAARRRRVRGRQRRCGAAFRDACVAAGIDARSPPTSAARSGKILLSWPRCRADDRRWPASRSAASARSRSARDVRSGGARSVERGPRTRHRARRRLSGAAARFPRFAACADALVDAERPRRRQSAGGAVAVRRRGRDGGESGIAAPVSATLYAAVKPYVDGAPADARLFQGNSHAPVAAPGSSTRLRCIALPYIFKSITVDSFVTALIVAVVLGLINTLIRPVLDPAHAAGDDPYARPVHLRDQRPAVLGGRHVHGRRRLSRRGFWAGVFGAIVYSLISWALSSLLLPKKEQR
jgi:putative membrane protein